MSKESFVGELRATAAQLAPLTKSILPGAASWNGTEYVKTLPSEPEPHALAWQAVLLLLANLIEAQQCTLSPKQIEYIHVTLFGGMGSLNDVFFDPRRVGPLADVVNKGLDRKRADLYAAFKSFERISKRT